MLVPLLNLIAFLVCMGFMFYYIRTNHITSAVIICVVASLNLSMFLLGIGV